MDTFDDDKAIEDAKKQNSIGRDLAEHMFAKKQYLDSLNMDLPEVGYGDEEFSEQRSDRQKQLFSKLRENERERQVSLGAFYRPRPR